MARSSLVQPDSRVQEGLATPALPSPALLPRWVLRLALSLTRPASLMPLRTHTPLPSGLPIPAPAPGSTPRLRPAIWQVGGNKPLLAQSTPLREFWFFTCHCLDVGQCIFRASFDEPLCCLQCVVLEIKLQLSVVLFLISAGPLESFPEIRLTVKSLMYLQCRCTCPKFISFLHECLFP